MIYFDEQPVLLPKDEPTEGSGEPTVIDYL